MKKLSEEILKKIEESNTIPNERMKTLMKEILLFEREHSNRSNYQYKSEYNEFIESYLKDINKSF